MMKKRMSSFICCLFVFGILGSVLVSGGESGSKSIDEFAAALVEAKAMLNEVPGMKPVFRLKPPAKGFGRRELRKPFSIGGVFGYRGENINKLLARMI